MTPDALLRLLSAVTPALDENAATWCLIGSGALVVLGVPVADAVDLDVVTDPEGARALRVIWSHWLPISEPRTPDGPFRSDDFARYETSWGPVEVMGGLWVRGERLTIGALHPGAPIPSAPEQLRILRLFGRPKDLAKAEMLEAWIAEG